jgi:hypothetical protein
VSSFVESGDQASVTFTISGPHIPQAVHITQIFTFRSGTNVVVQMNDGVDVLALRALQAEAEDEADGEDDE